MKPGIGFALVLSAILWGGCASEPAGCQTARSINSYRASPQLPAPVRRVALLPATVGASDPATEAGRDALEPVLSVELRKRAVADLVVVDREQLRNWTGQEEWTTSEALPQDFFERLHKATGCDAVMFCHLTVFRAYPPLEVGWTMELVDAQKRVLWAADEVFDAGDPAVAAAARGYYTRHAQGFLRDPESILSSPRSFGQYAAAAVLQTLPSR